jgi:ubiquinone/menaquinone biosynthesis C-methylase UbiE
MENHFDQVAREWDMNRMHTERTKAIAEALLEGMMPRNKVTMLEFGAGTGLLSLALKDYFESGILMDSSAEMVAVMKEKLEMQGIHHLQAVCFDLEKNHFTDHHFDVILTQMALHHVSDIDSLLQKFRLLLKPGGFLAIADLYTEDGSFHDRSFTGHLGFDPEELSARLLNSGFQNMAHSCVYTITKPSESGDLKAFPVFLLTCVRTDTVI